MKKLLVSSPAIDFPRVLIFLTKWAKAGLPTIAYLWAIACLSPIVVVAQNTIGGVKTTIPEAEVKRQSQFLVAERERLLNHNDKALELYKKFTYDNPDVDAGWYGLARTHTALKDLPNALQSIGKAVTLAPENRWYSIFQAEIFEKVGRLSEAVEVYENLLKRFPETPEFYEQLAYLSLQNEDPKRALKALDKWENLVGVNEEIAFKKHVVYVGLGDAKKAAIELKKLCDTHPNEMKYREDLAAFYDKIGDKVNARATYDEILRRDADNPVARMALAGAQGSSDAAKLGAMRPLFDDPKVPIDEKIKAVMPYFQKMTNGGDAALTQILLDLAVLLEKNHPEEAKAWSLSGDLFYHANRPADALERYRRCIQLNPTVFAVWDNALSLLVAQKNYDEMLRTAERAMDAFPNQPKVYFYYGVAANILGHSGDALAQLEQGLLMTANNTSLRLDIVDQIGLALMGKKDFAGAVTRFEQSLARGGDQHPGILEHLGDALSLQGQAAQAVEYWKKANAIHHSNGLELKISSGKL
ncbi:MAG: tetratricopeptide repeat protein [Phycisphaerae bacterium]|nr:tetratricopeptide repeat protein [Saprospiraceae bacterium]